MSDFKIDFTGIGVAKAGTTWLAACLGQHPEVCIGKGKELNYFILTHVARVLPVQTRFYGISHFERGLGWYEAQFAHREPGQRCGEYSNAYIADPESARLLHEHNPDLKLICCFRNPVEVMYAGYNQLRRVQPIHESFEAIFEKYPQFLNYGCFYENLQPFLAQFPREQFCFLLHDDIKADSAAVFQTVCRFLGVDPDFKPEALNQRINPRTVLRSTKLRDLRCAISKFMGSSAPMRSVRSMLIKTGVAHRTKRLFQVINEKPGQDTPLAPETRQRLAKHFAPENDKLAELLGRDLSHWNP